MFQMSRKKYSLLIDSDIKVRYDFDRSIFVPNYRSVCILENRIIDSIIPQIMKRYKVYED